MTDIKKMAEGCCVCVGQDCYCSEAFLAGAEAYKKSLLEVGVDGAKKVEAYHCKYTDVFTLSSGGSINKPVTYIEALPALARIAELEEENKRLNENTRRDFNDIQDLKSDLAAKTAAVEELVSISQRAMRQWHMHMTDLQQEDLDELLKDENNHEAHDYKKLFELLTKHAKGD